MPGISSTGFFIGVIVKDSKNGLESTVSIRERENGGRKWWSEITRKSTTRRGEREEEATQEEYNPHPHLRFPKEPDEIHLTTERFETKQLLLIGGRHHHRHGSARTLVTRRIPSPLPREGNKLVSNSSRFAHSPFAKFIVVSNLCPAATAAAQFSIVPPPSSTTSTASRSLITDQPDNLTISTQICFNRTTSMSANDWFWGCSTSDGSDS
ncbi:hypothetical protein AGABI1DRAFT_126599 [Agaricus bisporus var. burnettii JB137-S8]|uniref:Uncharacterized protein n=1 Tax=Agaricus bisporus var. burnettii (strain JB137-S8 / ATCC MYA-4627 / FGSC 10392) TaxID=597362 RepID=K5W614_AGABU|nr:uncharacterized protein AGABI1DRAFT_126599 [Agaricus bisporus var. burnettii JB137-S8]EKM82269.1 hypothetical protein AGABI1DRAFT_126599 [Agaricus bisporus var. burnettii JB137-S8]